MFDLNMHLSPQKMSAPQRSKEDTDTRSRILAVATEAFADHGFDAVAIRDITAAAGANGAAVNYYFGSKEQLIAEVFQAVVGPIHRQRIERLHICVAAAAPGWPTVNEIVRAFVEPPIRAARGPGKPEGGTYHRFHILAYALRRPFAGPMMSELSDQVALEFIEALAKALPDIPREDVCWRYDFMIGSLVHILLDADRSRRLQRISNGACDTGDPNRIMEQLTMFLVSGFRGQAASRHARDTKPRASGSPAKRKVRSRSRR